MLSATVISRVTIPGLSHAYHAYLHFGTIFSDIVFISEDKAPPYIIYCPPEQIDGFVPEESSEYDKYNRVSFQEPEATDDTPLTITRSHAPLTRFEAGTTTEVVYNFTDEARNVASCTFLITIHGKGS